MAYHPVVTEGEVVGEATGPKTAAAILNRHIDKNIEMARLETVVLDGAETKAWVAQNIPT